MLPEREVEAPRAHLQILRPRAWLQVPRAVVHQARLPAKDEDVPTGESNAPFPGEEIEEDNRKQPKRQAFKRFESTTLSSLLKM